MVIRHTKRRDKKEERKKKKEEGKEVIAENHIYKMKISQTSYYSFSWNVVILLYKSFKNLSEWHYLIKNLFLKIDSNLNLIAWSEFNLQLKLRKKKTKTKRKKRKKRRRRRMKSKGRLIAQPPVRSRNRSIDRSTDRPTGWPGWPADSGRPTDRIASGFLIKANLIDF